MTEMYPRMRIKNAKREIFDVVRKKYVALTPEEIIRQQLLHFLITIKHFPPALIRVETSITYNSRIYRADIIACDRRTKPLLIAECKAADVKITQDTFEQIARYNLALKVPYLLVTNGVQHFFCRFDSIKNRYCFEDTMPDYENMIENFRN